MRTKKKTSQTYLYIFTSTLLVVLYSLFRAYMDHLTFLVALDKVVSTVFSELWDLISTPTVFFVLTAALVIYSLRKEIRQFFPAIKEIKAGAFSATMDFSHVINETMLDLDKKDVNKTLNSEKASSDVSDFLISRLGRESLQLMLEIDGTSTYFGDILEMMDRLQVGDKYIDDEVFKTLEHTTKTLYRLGSLLVFMKVIFPAFFYETLDETIPEVTKHLRPGVRSKIEAKLKQFEPEKRNKKSY